MMIVLVVAFVIFGMMFGITTRVMTQFGSGTSDVQNNFRMGQLTGAINTVCDASDSETENVQISLPEDQKLVLEGKKVRLKDTEDDKVLNKEEVNCKVEGGGPEEINPPEDMVNMYSVKPEGSNYRMIE